MLKSSESATPAEIAVTPAPEAAKLEEAKPAKEEVQTPEPGTGATKQQEETEEELPEGVKKRIASEAKKQAFFQSKIDQAVSARKAKEAEAQKLTDKPGSDPAKITESAKDERPKPPDQATFQGTLAEYNAALTKWQGDLETWLENRTAATVEQKLTERQASQERQKAWDAATVTHGAEFPALMDVLSASTPVGLQRAISALGDWSGVAVHLAKNEAERDALVAEFKTNEYSAIAKLGKLEDRLKPVAKTESAAKPEELPRPLKPVAGNVSSTGVTDLEKADMRTFRQELAKLVPA